MLAVLCETLLGFYQLQYSNDGFSGILVQKLEKQTKTIVSNTQKPSTIGGMELLSQEQIDT